MHELTQRLSTGTHPVTVRGSQSSLEDIRRRLEETDHILVKFTGTRGGTELGFPVDRAASDLSAADFDNGSGMLHVEGNLILNDDPVRCVADIDLATLDGTGRLVPVEEPELVS